MRSTQDTLCTVGLPSGLFLFFPPGAADRRRGPAGSNEAPFIPSVSKVLRCRICPATAAAAAFFAPVRFHAPLCPRPPFAAQKRSRRLSRGHALSGGRLPGPSCRFWPLQVHGWMAFAHSYLAGFACAHALPIQPSHCLILSPVLVLFVGPSCSCLAFVVPVGGGPYSLRLTGQLQI